MFEPADVPAPHLAIVADPDAAPITPASLLRTFARWPAEQRLGILVGLLRGLLAVRAFDARAWPIIGRGVRIGKRNGRIFAGSFARFGEGCRVAVISRTARAATLHIGARSVLGARCIINAAEEITIGEGCSISWDCNIMDTDFHRVDLGGGEAQRPVTLPVRIGDRVLIGAHSMVLKGVTIGHDSVVAAGSVVTRDVPAHTLVAGNPARVVRRIAGWSRRAD